MTKHDFIFSGQRKHRLARHVVFWLTWCVAFNLLFHFPIHVFKGWDVSGPGTRNYQDLGPVLFFFKALFVNCFLAVIVPQILLTYVIMYWLLPRYVAAKENYLLTAIISSFVMVVFYFLAVSFKHTTAIYNKLVHGSNLWPYLDPVTLWVVAIDQLSTLPIVLGSALTLKLVKKWWLKQKETEQLAKEKTNAELQLLKAQVHPHFLFNTINNIYSFILTGSSRAPEVIKKLSGLLNYILHECNRPVVSLEKEIEMIQNYLELEKIRYNENMEITFKMEGNCKGKMIAPLLLIPFVENSFKHGASKLITNPLINLLITVEDNRLQFKITNNKPSRNPAVTCGQLGLKNVKKRLSLLYNKKHELNIASEAESYSVDLSLELDDRGESVAITNDLKSANEYAIA